MKALITMGETMCSFLPQDGEISRSEAFSLSMGGAEFNTAVWLARLSCPTYWIGRVGTDGFGDRILQAAKSEGVNVDFIASLPDKSTGLMVKERSASGERRVIYYRKGSAGSHIVLSEQEKQAIAQAGVLHISGITPSLSGQNEETVKQAVEIALLNGVPFSFDPNLRPKFMTEENYDTIRFLCDKANILLVGKDELISLYGENMQYVLDLMVKKGKIVAVKDSDKGSYVFAQGSWQTVPPVKTEFVDSVGAGDAFNAGFLCGFMQGKDVLSCAKLGNEMGAKAVSIAGDF